MMVTEKIIETLYAQYWGQYVARYGTQLGGDSVNFCLRFISDYKDYDFKNILNWKLVLKPLSKIYPEDDMELCDIIDSFSSSNFINALLNNEYYALNAMKSVEAYQFLISKGYDLPQPSLEGKTLFQAGLAIYENEEIL